MLALPKIELPSLDSEKYNRLKSLLKRLYPENWGTAPDADEMAMDVSVELNDLGFESPFLSIYRYHIHFVNI
jgi:hypothetical protein